MPLRRIVVRLLAWLLVLFPFLGPVIHAQPPGNGTSEFQLDGVKVLVQTRPGSQTVAGGIFFRGGRLNSSPENAGIEALLLGTAIEGGAHFPRNLLRTELARLAAELDYRCLDDYSVLSFRCTADVFSEVAAITADVALNPALEKEDVERVKRRLVLQAASDADIEVVRKRRSGALLFANHPYAPDPDGTPETLERLTVEDLRRHHRLLASRNRLLVVVVGGVRPEDVRAAFDGAFGDIAEGAEAPDPPAVLGFEESRVTRSELGVDVPRIDINFAGPRPSAPDFPAFQFAASVLQARLNAVLRDREALSYDPQVDIQIAEASRGVIRFSASNLNEAVRQTVALIDGLRSGLLPDSLMSATAAQMQSRDYTEAQTNEARAARLAEFELIRGGWQLGFEQPYKAVTADEVREAVRAYFRNFQTLVLGSSRVRVDSRILQE